ncbi:MAG: DUF2791 family P-loop domain-containing protein [Bacillota bacterium]|nr:DUF2791 family P-loop domain-containing protein [Bacillota bacterium]
MERDARSVAWGGYQVFECAIVALIKRTLLKAYGDDWEEGGFSWLLGQLKERKRSVHPLSRAQEPASLLGYAHVGELKQVIVNKRNWPLFKPLFQNKDRLGRDLDVLTEIRPQLAHPGDTVTSVEDARYALMTAKKILEVFDKEASIQLSRLGDELDALAAAEQGEEKAIDKGVGAQEARGGLLDQGKALQIIARLRKGVPPTEDVALVSVGRERLTDHFREKLGQIKEYGLSDVKFISADFGQGKTHFLDLLGQLAFELDFVVSHVELSTEAPFDKLELVVKRLAQRISTREFREDGLTKILDKWSAGLAGKSETDVYHAIESVPFPQMREKLAQYCLAHNNPSGIQFSRKLELLRWFRGEETKSKTFTSIKEYLHGLVEFLRLVGYSGLVVMLDEAEAIVSLTRVARRDLANENIRQIIDNDADTEGFYFVFASTPTFFDDTRTGAPTYDALWRRIRHPLGQLATRSLENVIIELPALDEEQFFELGRKIRSIYEIAKGRPSRVTDEHLRALASHVQRRADRRVGTLVRSVVAGLQDADQPAFDLTAEYPLLVERIIEEEKRERSA